MTSTSARGDHMASGGNKASRSRTASSPMEMPEVLTPPRPARKFRASAGRNKRRLPRLPFYGVTDVRFLGYRDGELTVSHDDLRRDISRVICQVRPQRVVIQSPERNWERIYHHIRSPAAGEAAIQAVYPDAQIHSPIQRCCRTKDSKTGGSRGLSWRQRTLNHFGRRPISFDADCRSAGS